MTTAAVEPRKESAVVVHKSITQVREALDARIVDIAAILPANMDAARFARVSLLAISKNVDILECSVSSIVLSIIEAAEVGLEPTGGIGGAHLVPFREGNVKKAQLIYDYRGVQHLIREGGGGEVKTVLVYDGDEFEVHEGTAPRIDHRPRFKTQDPSKITFVYAWPLDHPDKFEVMTKAQIDGIRARSKASNKGPWVTDFGAMSRKSVLKRISAWLPLKPSIRAILERDTERDIAPSEPLETVKSRTAEVRERVAARSQRLQAAPSDPEGSEVAQSPIDPPDESAGGQTDAEGETREVCGATSDPALGEVDICVLEPDHLTVKGSAQRHQSTAGSVWPA